MNTLSYIFKSSKVFILGFTLLLSCAAGLLSSCHSKIAPQSVSARETTAQRSTLNLETTDTHGNPELLGHCTRERLQQAPYNAWFVKNYKDYTIDSATANQLKPLLAGKQFMIFMGTWCGDSQREVPRLFKIFDYCGLDASALKLIMVSNADSTYKQSPGHEEHGRDIFRVPDLLLLQNGQELGRIVESPVNSLEKDLLALAAGQTYSPNYKGADFLIHLFRQESKDQIESRLPAIAQQIRPLLSSPAELKPYARVMQTAGEKDKAEIALKLNNLIFTP